MVSIAVSQEGKKSWTSCKSITLLIIYIELKPQGKLLPLQLERQTGEYRESQLMKGRCPGAEFHRWCQSRQEHLHFNDKLLEVWCGLAWELKSPCDPSLSLILSPGIPRGSQQWRLDEKSSHTSGRRKGKVTILKYAQISVLSLTMPALRGNNFVRA